VRDFLGLDAPPPTSLSRCITFHRSQHIMYCTPSCQ